MINPRRGLILGLLALVLLAFAGVHAYVFIKQLAIQLPPYEPVEVIHLPEQNWTPDERQWFYHETQGGAFELPLEYSWLKALEQPRIPFSIFGEVPKFMDRDYISRFGFLPDTVQAFNPNNVGIQWAVIPGRHQTEINALNNADRLPVGMARNPDYKWPIPSDEPKEMIGFTCAACHVGQLNIEKEGTKYGIRIDGGPAMTDLTKFELAIGLSVGLTLLPIRFDRFATEVLGPNHTSDQRSELRTKLRAFIDQGKKIEHEADSVYTTRDGFARLDALGRIDNFVFAEELSRSNWSLSNAPVNYPPLWDAPWFNWVQYNGSIMRPMVRNAGEAMGVFARVNFDSLSAPGSKYLFRSNVRVDNLHEMEMLIRGEKPFDGLRSPKWPVRFFGYLNDSLVTRGNELYDTHCKSCHHAAPVEGSAFFDPSDRTVWTEPDSVTGLSYLDLKLVNLYEIGTDPLQAQNFARRVVKLGALGETFRDSLAEGSGGLVMGSEALPFVVRMTIDKAYDDLGLSDSLRNIWNGLRPDSIRAPLAYKARPLDGVWATAPYLHNGSVPTLYQLLSPYAERDETFWLGTKDFDTKDVGFVTDRVSGGFLLDTSRPGNSNWGHLFQGTFNPDSVNWSQLPSGIIGPTLPEPDRRALVEFLKSL